MSAIQWQADNIIQGVGLGFRACHYADIVENLPPIPWFEIITENYLGKEGFALEQLRTLRKHYPIVFHGVGMSLGSTDALNLDYLQQLKKMMQDIKPAYISEHLCWTSVHGQYFHELLPLPYTQETINHVSDRIKKVQDFLGQAVLIENVSSYLSYHSSSMPEWEFINAIAEQAQCFILLDLNNIYVSAYNHGFDAEYYLSQINPQHVKQFHLAGFLDCETHYLDDHGSAVCDEVWNLYQYALKKMGPVPSLIEWDNNIPSFLRLQQEGQKAQLYLDKIHA